MNLEPTKSKTEARSCLFCGSVANSREHVIPEWLSKRMAIRHLEFHPAHFGETKGLQVRPPIRCEYLKTKHVCNKCNVGWMSELEVWAQNHFGDYVEPNIAFDDLVGLLPIREEPSIIIRWLLKTAIMVEKALPRGAEGKVVPALNPVAFGTKDPTDFFVWAAYVDKPNFNLHLVRGFPVWNGGILQPFQIHAESMDFALQLNHLALRLFRCPDASPTFKAAVLYPDDFRAAPMHLTMKIPFPFPNRPIYPTFELFRDALEVNANLSNE
ncbi:MAG: hypothetical protein WCH43_10880 [Verrucomicrobiota bacterium]